MSDKIPPRHPSSPIPSLLTSFPRPASPISISIPNLHFNIGGGGGIGRRGSAAGAGGSNSHRGDGNGQWHYLTDISPTPYRPYSPNEKGVKARTNMMMMMEYEEMVPNATMTPTKTIPTTATTMVANPGVTVSPAAAHTPRHIHSLPLPNLDSTFDEGNTTSTAYSTITKLLSPISPSSSSSTSDRDDKKYIPPPTFAKDYTPPLTGSLPRGMPPKRCHSRMKRMSMWWMAWCRRWNVGQVCCLGHFILFSALIVVALICYAVNGGTVRIKE